MLKDKHQNQRWAFDSISGKKCFSVILEIMWSGMVVWDDCRGGQSVTWMLRIGELLHFSQVPC